VTALYEIVPAGASSSAPRVDPLRYQEARRAAPAASSDELMTVKLRYKEPDAETSQLRTIAVKETGPDDSADVRFAAAVAGFGMLLRDSEHKGTATYAAVLELARQGRGEDPDGYRAEFVQLIESARILAESETARAGS